jgi:hypothetical protein
MYEDFQISNTSGNGGNTLKLLVELQLNGSVKTLGTVGLDKSFDFIDIKYIFLFILISRLCSS